MAGPRLFDLAGRCALVTGGSRGLGKAMARGLVEAGADVAISSRHEDELNAALGDILAGTPRRGCAIVADLAKRNEVDRLAREALERLGKIDILINNAGSNVPQPIDQIKDDDWDLLIEVHLRAAMALSRAVAPGMKVRRWGRIIHISSTFAFVSKAGRNAYSAAKTALRGLARPMALDLGPYGITVNCIAPGPFLTDLPMSLLSEAERQQFADHTALGRWGQPDELIGPMLLLASDAGAYITGTTIVVDGGYLTR
jgi:NAD(P)-dependent dehydrogenase (short-subunit alcohol dehydrogenase family)